MKTTSLLLALALVHRVIAMHAVDVDVSTPWFEDEGDELGVSTEEFEGFGGQAPAYVLEAHVASASAPSGGDVIVH